MSRISQTSVGHIELTSLTDGETVFGNELFPNASDAEISTLLANAGAENIDTNFNAFLVKSGSDTLLVDAGPRDLFGETCGFLGDAISEAGASEDGISHLFLTHLHPDHIAGAITPEGAPVFKNAQVIIPEAEVAFWSDASQFTDETLQQWQQLAAAVMAAYAGRIEQVSDGATLINGVTTVDMPGHTPGHQGFRVDDGDNSFVHVGDIAHSQALQLANPEISVVFDIDPDKARETRKRVLDMVATDGMQFSGGHILRPTIGVLRRAGTGYKFAPE